MRNGRLLFILTTTLAINHAYAIVGNFSDDVNYANGSINSENQTLPKFDPTQFKNYTSNPNATKYYQNGASDSNIKNDTPNAVSNSAGAQTIENTFGKDQAFAVNPNAPEIARSNIMQQDAYDVTHGISDQYIQCVPKSNACTTTYTQKICTSAKPTSLACVVTPVVTINSVPYQAVVVYNGSITPSNAYQGTFQLPESGILQNFSVTMKSGNIWSCFSNYQGYVNNDYISTYYPNCGNRLGDLSFFSNSLSTNIEANAQIPFQIKGGPAFSNWEWANYSVALLVTRYKNVPTVTMSNSCSSIPAICSLSKTSCTQPGGNRVFDDVSVYQPCWSTENDYSCGPADDHSCDALTNAGCSMVNLQCTDTFNKTCVQYQDTMSCPVQTCKTNDVICGTHSFCMDGNCYQSQPTQNQNFGKDEAQFAAASGSAASVAQNQQSLQAFSGNSMNCSLAPIGFLNCCADNGWGKNIHLASCSSEEKELGVAKQNGYTIYLGKYCSHKILGICTQHRESYCVFNGLLAKDVQQQGRAGQLGIGFGSSKSPNCSGIAVTDLQRIDFSKIDFSNLEKSLQNQKNLPTNESVQQYISNKVKQEMGQKGQQSQ